MLLIDKSLINQVSEKAQASPRLRMNYNLHSDLSDKCQRLLNALEPGTIMPIHRHEVDEVYFLLRGKIEVMTFDDNKNIIERIILSPSEGKYGVQIPKNIWHSLEVYETGSIIFEVKEGPYIPHEEGGILQ